MNIEEWIRIFYIYLIQTDNKYMVKVLMGNPSIFITQQHAYVYDNGLLRNNKISVILCKNKLMFYGKSTDLNGSWIWIA